MILQIFLEISSLLVGQLIGMVTYRASENISALSDLGASVLASCASKAFSSETAIQPLGKPKPSAAKSRVNIYGKIFSTYLFKPLGNLKECLAYSLLTINILV